MLRILLISDTHGNLDGINELAKEKKADLVIHAGDFGFYDQESVLRLNPKELRLLIVHSPYRDLLKSEMNRQELIQLIEKYGLLGHFPDYLSGQKEFEVPIYAIWGNHEDHQVIEKLRQGKKIQNLHLLDEHNHFTISDGGKDLFELYGLGGNFLINKKTFTSTFQGEGGKVQATFHQFGTLFNHIKRGNLPSIFVSHVCPGKEPLLTRLLSHLAPNFWISGHMGPPFPCVWNQAAIHRWTDIEAWMSDLSPLDQDLETTEEGKKALDLIKSPLENRHDWVRKTWNINLPDFYNGHALLLYDKGNFALETFGTLRNINGAH